ncbi:MAG: LAGLIDADG family homing endonuclease [Cetobacterium sp.]
MKNIKEKEQIEYLNSVKERFLNGMSLTKICKEDKKSISKTSKLLKEKLNFYETSFKNKNNKSYEYNEEIFEIIDTEEKAYWLGFLYADGTVTKRLIKKENRKDKFSYQLELCLAEKDKEHLIKFGNFIFENFNLEKNLKKRKIKLNNKTHIAYRLTINCKKIVEDLIKLGCVPKKSLILEFPTNEQVPIKLQKHFIRGYFDGDGCIYFDNNLKKKNGLVVLGTEKFLKKYNTFLNENNIETKKISSKKSKAFETRIYKQKDIKLFYNLIYKNSIIFLNRKKEKFLL